MAPRAYGAIAALAGLAALCACDAAPRHAGGGVCAEAAAIAAECTGEAVEVPAEGCVGEYKRSAEEIVEGGCDALGTGGKVDGFWCSPATRWLGQCDDVELSEAASIEALDDVCDGRDDALCDALEAGDYESARDTVALRVAGEPRDAVVTDTAVRFYLRERVTSLLVWNVLRAGFDQPPADYATKADAVLSEHFPGYDPRQFEMARRWLPPMITGCEGPSDAVVFFPGVVRLTDRKEFAEQSESIEAALPCVRTFLVDTGSFVDPLTNAAQGRAAIERVDAEVDGATLHLVGYSQGATNTLTTLVEFDDISSRTATVLVMNSAAHGSEVADTLVPVIEHAGDDLCAELWEFARPTCEWAAALSPRPNEFLMDAIAAAMGVPTGDLQAFIEAEDGVDAAPTLRAFFERHGPGVRSLGTAAADEFWRQRGDELPRDVLYYSFRSAISETSKNLPFSNRLFHALLERAGTPVPWNDMQVRLENQELGGPVSDSEIVGPVAEGNHWQWELATGAVPASVMPTHMTDRIPHREILVAYLQALAEVGLIGQRP